MYYLHLGSDYLSYRYIFTYFIIQSDCLYLGIECKMSTAARKSMDYHMMRKIDSMTYYLAAKTPGIGHEMACTDAKFYCKTFLLLHVRKAH